MIDIVSKYPDSLYVYKMVSCIPINEEVFTQLFTECKTTVINNTDLLAQMIKLYKSDNILPRITYELINKGLIDLSRLADNIELSELKNYSNLSPKIVLTEADEADEDSTIDQTVMISLDNIKKNINFIKKDYGDNGDKLNFGFSLKDFNNKGVMITNIETTGIFSAYALKPGFVIQRINGIDVKNISEFKKYFIKL